MSAKPAAASIPRKGAKQYVRRIKQTVTPLTSGNGALVVEGFA